MESAEGRILRRDPELGCVFLDGIDFPHLVRGAGSIVSRMETRFFERTGRGGG